MTEGEIKIWLEALTKMKPTVTNHYHGNIGTQINTDGGAVTLADGKAILPNGEVVTTSAPPDRKGKSDVRTMPTYALSEYGRQHEAEAKKSALEAYEPEWGTSSTCALLVRVLQLQGIIDKTGVPAVRLLVHWGLVMIAEEEMKRVSDNWNAKLAKLSGDDSTQWALTDQEQFAYNSILECFES